MTKKNISLLWGALLLCCFTQAVHAVAPSLAIKNATGYEDSIVIVSIMYGVYDVPQPTALKFRLNYPHANLIVGKPTDGVTLTGSHIQFSGRPIITTSPTASIDIIVSPKKENLAITEGEIVQIPFVIQGSSSGLVTRANLSLSLVEMSNGAPISAGTVGTGTVYIIWNDTDGDGVPDNQDEFPNDGSETIDTDNDGIGDEADGDDDNDGIPDHLEAPGKSLIPNADEDSDGDGLSNVKEIQIGTNPLISDTDGDGMPDGWEYENGLNPLDDTDAGPEINIKTDPDSDGLTNLQEYLNGTDPHNPDTDGDGVSDADEVAAGTDPNLNIPAIMIIIQQLLYGN